MAATGATAPPSYAFTPQQIRAAYGIDSISAGSLIGDGTGQTIAIVAPYDNPKLVSSTNASFFSSDLGQFDAYFGLPDPPSFRKLDQTGGTNYPAFAPANPGGTGWAGEAALDVEWAHAIAPQANMVLVEANTPGITDFISAVVTAKNLPGVSVVSMSFGWTEAQISAFGGPTFETAMDTLFTTPAGHQGVTFVAATGNSGSAGNYPACSPNVLAVGGTTLSASYGSYAYETGWSSSAGGPSVCETEPSFQQMVQQSGWRETPDVAFDGDPNTGVAVYDSYDMGISSPWTMIGGTSLATPSWAGLIAIANQLRAGQGLGSLDGPTQTLPGLYALPPADFHDVTSGNNNGFSAGVGYDEVTGLGSPVANLLVPDLAALRPPSASVTTPSSPQTGNVTIAYSLTDANSDVCTILVEYSVDGGATWKPATAGPGGDGTTSLLSSPSGQPHTFVWASGSDQVSADSVEVRVTPADASAGTAGASGVFAVNNGQIFHLTGPMSGAYQAGQNVAIGWTAAGVVAGGKISLCYDSDTTFNGNEHWIEIDQVAAADGSGSYGAWNTANVPAGTYYLAGYMYDGKGKFTFSHLTQPITITAVQPVTITAATPAAQSFTLGGPTLDGYRTGQTVDIFWTAGGVAAGSKISLCYDTDKTFNKNEHWIEIDGVAAADGTGTYGWNTAGVAPGTYYLAGYMYDGKGTFTFSHLTQAITITAASSQTFAITAPTLATYQAGTRWTSNGRPTE